MHDSLSALSFASCLEISDIVFPIIYVDKSMSFVSIGAAPVSTRSIW